MKKDIQSGLNGFFVECFNAILRNEEKSLEQISNGKLSLKEIHLLEAIDRTKNRGENTSTGVAKHLGITLGSLTVAVNVLERKGFVVREREGRDKRLLFLSLTELGEYVNEYHKKYHEKMIDDVLETLDESEQKSLLSALVKLQNYFNS